MVRYDASALPLRSLASQLLCAEETLGGLSQQEFVFDANANIFLISNEMKVFPVQKKERALLITPQEGPKIRGQ